MRCLCRLVVLLAIGACVPEPVTVPEPPTPYDTGIPTLPDPPTPEGPCGALELLAPADVSALQEVQLAVIGGIGPFRYSVLLDRSGAAMEPSSGVYLAGSEAGLDVLQVEDEGCDQVVGAEVQVHPAFSVHPEQAVVPPGQAFVFSATGGSGDVQCSAVDLASGGSLNGCAYVAGSGGEDVVRVEDRRTGQSVDAVVRVEDVELLDVETLLLPVGFGHRLAVSGGSGALAGALPNGLSVTDGVVLASVPGSWTVELSDPSTGMVDSLDVRAAAPQTFANGPEGNLRDWASTVLADVTGDGVDDLVVGSIDSSVGHYRSGGAFVFDGAADFSGAPDAVLGGSGASTAFGRSVAAGDFDGDGVLELVVGESGAPEGGSARGRVVMYGPDAAGLPTVERWTASGGANNDQLGYALAVCDLDGDGFDDLLAGAPNLDDRTVVPSVSDAGGVRIWRGGPTGLSGTATTWFGRRPAAGAWVEATASRAGGSLAVGDLDGDGGCDVAVGGHLGSVGPAGGTGGGVWLVDGASLLTGGLPRHVFGTAATNNARLGRELALGDLDGDGLDDLVAGARLEDARRGQVVAWWSSTIAGLEPVDVHDSTSADVVLTGDQTNDTFGWSIALAGDEGLLVGAPQDEVGTGNAGAVHWYGAADLLVGGELGPADATASFGWTTGGDMYGVRVHPLPDGDGDGVPGFLSFVARGDGLGIRDGFAVQEPGGAVLELPSEPAGAFFGSSLAWFEADADAGQDLLVGAIGLSQDRIIDQGGVVGPDGTWPRHPGDHNLERSGGAIVPVGDLDGDGYDDLAVVAEFRTRQANLPAAYAPTVDCPEGGASAAGAIYLHRGGPDGVAVQPSWVVFGDEANDRVAAVAGLDFDGDGLQDLAYGGIGLANQGEVRVIGGPFTAPPEGTIERRCDATFTVTGRSAGSQLGRRIGAVSDLDGDGCDELVIGAPNDDLGGTNTGSVRLVWGQGTPCEAGRITTVSSGEVSAGIGFEVASGEDLDGDGQDDLVASNPNYQSSTGAVWRVGGSEFLGTGQAFTGGTVPAGVDIVPTRRLVGDRVGDALGASVGMGHGLAFIGRPGALDEGVERGRVEGWSPDGAGFGRRTLVVGGEMAAGRLGQALASGDGVLAVAATWSDLDTVDGGTVYSFLLP